MLIFLESIIWVLRFFFGACIASFLNVAVCRLPKGESVVSGRSHCTVCGRILKPWELIPCISYLALRGKCAGCKAHIPARDFITEIIGGAAFITCAVRYGCGTFGILSLKGTVILIYLGILMVVALIDWDTQIIYDRFHIMILILAMINMWLFQAHSLKDCLLGAVIIAGPMLILALLIPGAFGGGDIKLMAASGLFLGTASIVCAMFFGLLTGGAYGSIMLKSGKLGRKDQFAFGPFLAVGLAVAAFYGDQIVSWYLRFF